MEAGALSHSSDHRLHDSIYLGNYRYDALVGLDCWGRKKAQQIVTSIRVMLNITTAGHTDDIGKTLNYGQVAKELAKSVREGREFGSFAELNEELCYAILRIKQVRVHITSSAPKGLLRGGFGSESWHGSGYQESVTVFDSLRLWVIIGVNDHERLARQMVVINLRVKEDASAAHPNNIRSSVEAIMNETETTEFKLLESLASYVADKLLLAANIHKVTISVEKPNALAFVDCAGVEITRSKDRSAA